MNKIEIPEFATKKELFKFIVENEASLIAQKKSAIKYASGFHAPATLLINEVGGVNVNKAAQTVGDLLEKDYIDVKAAINTTNMVDTHSDLHIPGMWDKSLKENKMAMHLEEHGMSFKNIIADGNDVKAYTEDVTWKSLGYNYPGKTQVLTHEARIHKARHPFMFEQYAKGYVHNHSVGMQYVKLVTCVNDDEYAVQKENWDKYIKEMINPEIAEEKGYFWAVTEAKYIEGSAVPRGSNHLTPTQSVKSNNEEEIIKELNAETKAIYSFLGINK